MDRPKHSTIAGSANWRRLLVTTTPMPSQSSRADRSHVESVAGTDSPAPDDGAVVQGFHPAAPVEGIGIEGALRPIEAGPEAGARAPFVGFGRQRRVEHGRHDGGAAARLQKAFQDVGRVAPAAAAGIVGRVGEAKGRQGRVPVAGQHHGDGFREGRHGDQVAFPFRPHVAGDPRRHPVRQGLVAAAGDGDAHAVLHRIAEGESAAQGNVHHPIAEQGLAEGDVIGVGASLGVLGDGGRDQGQLGEADGGRQPVQHSVHGLGAFGPPRVLVHVGVGQVAAHHVDGGRP